MCRERRHFIHALLGGRTASHSRRLCLRFGVVAAVLSLAVFMTPARADFFNATDAAIGTYAFASGSPSLADYNNDGLLDVGAGYHVMRNNGPDSTGQYTLSIIGGIPENDNGIFGDYDKDGFLD